MGLLLLHSSIPYSLILIEVKDDEVKMSIDLPESYYPSFLFLAVIVIASCTA
jgi:hypothetical protein